MRVKGTFSTQKQLDNISPPASGRDWWRYLRCNGLYVVVSANGNRVWYAQIKVDGTPKQYRLGPYHPGAEEADEALTLAQATKITDGARENIFAKQDPFPDQSSNYFPARWEAFKKSHIQMLAQGTQLNYQTLRNHIGPRWDEKLVSDITDEDAANLLDGIRDSARARGNKGLAAYNNNLSYLKKFFRYCWQRKLFKGEMPLSRITIEKQDVRRRILAESELTAIWNAAGEEPYPYRQLIRFAMAVPVRIWSEAGMIRRRHVENGVWTYTVPKTGIEQKLPLPMLALELLDDCPDMGELYFQAPIGKGAQVSLKRRLAKRATVDDWNFHDFRTAFLTHLRNLGVPFDVADQIQRPVREEVGARHYDLSEREEEKGELLMYWEYVLECFFAGQAINKDGPIKRWREWVREATAPPMEASS